MMKTGKRGGMMKRAAILLILPALLLSFAACGDKTPEPTETAAPPISSEETATTKEPEKQDDPQDDLEEEVDLKMMIGETAVKVEWEDNESVKALLELAKGGPLTVQMSMYGGFEQVGSLGTSLPRNDAQTTTQAGDIVLYSGDQIVVFYGSNSWAYTRLGHITDKTAGELAELLGHGDVTITLSVE